MPTTAMDIISFNSNLHLQSGQAAMTLSILQVTKVSLGKARGPRQAHPAQASRARVQAHCRGPEPRPIPSVSVSFEEQSFGISTSLGSLVLFAYVLCTQYRRRTNTMESVRHGLLLAFSYTSFI